MNHAPIPSFDSGLSLHRQGRLLEADRAYQAVINTDATHAPALLHLGVLRLQQGRTAEAESLLRRAVAADPCAAAHANLGAALAALGRAEDAIAAHQAATSAEPEVAEYWYGLATALQAADRHDDALAAFATMAALSPDQPEAAYGAATCLQALERDADALAQYSRALALDPRFIEALYGKATSLQRLDQHDAAIACFEQALALDPNYGDAHHGIAISLLAQDFCPQALDHLDRALQADPESDERHYRRGDTLMMLDRFKEAEAAYRKASDLAPERVEAILGLASAMAAQRIDADVLPLYERARALRPKSAIVLTGYAGALLPLDRHEEALALLEEAVALRPRLPMAWGTLGNLKEQLGDLAGAKQAFLRAVRLAPRRPAYYAGLFNAAKVQPGDPLIARLENLVNDGRTLRRQDRIVRLFALAKAYDDTGEKARAFECLLEGNAMKRAMIQHDEAPLLAGNRRIQARLAGPAILAASGRGDPTEVPIFVLGMPRSGSTLVEQILASHPLVHPGGERKDFSKAMRQTWTRRRGEFSGDMVDAAALRKLARLYLDALPPLPPGKTRITDKMPGNYRIAGLIHVAMPNARIIHTRRDPVDTCLSCFSKLFGDELNWSYELGELGRHYRQYQDMMEHWEDVLPRGTILDVQYEDVVDDLEGQARRLLDFCGLPWDDACLAFHETKRPVRTASVAQVREPIYRRSVGKWRPEEAVLRPLLEGLASSIP
jgi:tetratricopeptide (TPR) repeat protein